MAELHTPKPNALRDALGQVTGVIPAINVNRYLHVNPDEVDDSVALRRITSGFIGGVSTILPTFVSELANGASERENFLTTGSNDFLNNARKGVQTGSALLFDVASIAASLVVLHHAGVNWGNDMVIPAILTRTSAEYVANAGLNGVNNWANRRFQRKNPNYQRHEEDPRLDR